MSSGLDLPDGDTVAPGDVILFEGYPYRYLDDETEGFVLSPVHWGDSELDLRFESADDLTERWGPDSRGRLTETEWRDWIEEAHADPRFGDEELDAVAEAVLPSRGLLDRVRGLF